MILSAKEVVKLLLTREVITQKNWQSYYQREAGKSILLMSFPESYPVVLLRTMKLL
jgi:hypothetical protein